MAAKPGMKPFSTRLSDDLRAKLQARAESMGVTESDLGRMILVEKLSESESPLAALTREFRSNAALIIAALSDSIDLDQARELVAQHVGRDEAVAP